MRGHELAEELGRTPRQLLCELNEMGEFVESAASTLEGAVVRRGSPSTSPTHPGAFDKIYRSGDSRNPG